MLRLSLCDHSDEYIIVKGTMTVANNAAQGHASNAANKDIIFKDCVSFTKCISTMNNVQVDDAHDIDAVIPIYILIEHSDNYSKTSEILWQYCRDKPAINDAHGNIVDFNADNDTTDSFKIKEKKTGQTNNNDTKDVEIMLKLKISKLKYLSNFWRTFEIPLINCKINLDLNFYLKHLQFSNISTDATNILK